MRRASHGLSNLWYRGHRRSEWRLSSTLHRCIGDAVKSAEAKGFKFTWGEQREILREEFKANHARFRSESWTLLGSGSREGWGTVFAMQHYGLPTRLLDWTESFACALFFAQDGRDRNEDASVWVLDAGMLNQLSLNIGLASIPGKPMPGFVDLSAESLNENSRVRTRRWHPSFEAGGEDLKSIAALPPRVNPRMVSQRSCFTVMGDSFDPLESQFGGTLVQRGSLKEIVLQPCLFDDAEEYLSLAGITVSTYFPDLEGLVREYKERIARNLKVPG